MSRLLSTDLSTQTLRFKPGGDPQDLEVAVSNLSSTFATFQLDIVASGVEAGDGQWYRLAPELSAKIPAGDRTRFSVTVLDVPPVPGGFVGRMTLTVRVFSLELQEEDRRVVNLIIEGSGVAPPLLELAATDLQQRPGDTVEIPVRLQNPNRTVASVRLRLMGLPAAWLPEGSERRLQIPPQGEVRSLFLCQLPTTVTEAWSQVYPFQVEAVQSLAAAVQVDGQLQVLPAGFIEAICEQPQQVIPNPDFDPEAAADYDSNEADAAQFPFPSGPGLDADDDEERGNPDLEPVPFVANANTAVYDLQFTNQSNVSQPISVAVYRQLPPHWRRWRRRDRNPEAFPPAVRIRPAAVDSTPGSVATLTVQIQTQRPWIGWTQQRTFQVVPQFAEPSVEPHPPQVPLIAKLRPRIPFWLQLLLLGGLVGWMLVASHLRANHWGPVNSIQLDGQANEMVSGSDDQTVKRWRIAGRRLRHGGTVLKSEQTNRAVRVVRYRPVNNDAIAVGFENGDIEVFDLLTEQPLFDLQSQVDDRVFDLRFSRNSRYLYSGHGSGAVRQWDLNQADQVRSPNRAATLRPTQTQQVGFAIQSLAVVGGDADLLAIAGRFNRLVLWNAADNSLIPADYPAGDANDYITDIAAADQRPERLATADNQGQIMLWNLRNCLDGDSVCNDVSREPDAHDGEPVRAVALSANGCFLASGGDDGRVKLWTVDGFGQILTGRTIGRSPQPINTVDMIQLPNRILVASGNNNNRIRLYHVSERNSECQ
jgi:hypothetical protein